MTVKLRFERSVGVFQVETIACKSLGQGCMMLQELKFSMVKSVWDKSKGRLAEARTCKA